MKAYQLKISLDYSDPLIWRRVIVPAGYTFSQLTVMLHVIMGWDGYHLSMYSFDNDSIRLIEDDGEMDMGDFLDSSEHLIDEFLDKYSSFEYVYDFGDSWEHTVEVEQITIGYDKNYPEIIEYAEDCPPEDCGGIGGYYDLLDILGDPECDDYEEACSWAEGMMMEFDMDDANMDLREFLYLSDDTCGPVPEVDLLAYLEEGGAGFPRIDIDMEASLETLKKAQDPEVMMSFIRDLTFTQAALRLLKNTSMTEMEVFDALEFDDRMIQSYDLLKDDIIDKE